MLQLRLRTQVIKESFKKNSFLQATFQLFHYLVLGQDFCFSATLGSAQDFWLCILGSPLGQALGTICGVQDRTWVRSVQGKPPNPCTISPALEQDV